MLDERGVAVEAKQIPRCHAAIRKRRLKHALTVLHGLFCSVLCFALSQAFRHCRSTLLGFFFFIYLYLSANCSWFDFERSWNEINLFCVR